MNTLEQKKLLKLDEVHTFNRVLIRFDSEKCDAIMVGIESRISFDKEGS